ncbi:MAG TPA: GGDEF domain-containing protein [Hansschlegelia sp.]
MTLALAASLMAIFLNDYRRSAHSLDALALFQQVLTAANRISAERGPMNAALGAPPSADAEAKQRLTAFRATVDASLDQLDRGDKTAELLIPKAELSSVRARLAAARNRADRILLSPEMHSVDALSDAIRQMFAVVDEMRPLMDATSLRMIARDASLSGISLLGQQLFELRDYAGRLTSILVPSIADRRMLTIDERRELSRTIGKIEQIWSLARPYLVNDYDLADQVKQVEDTYFKKGLGYVARWANEGAKGEYSVTTSEMTALIVPTFQPIESLRQLFLDAVIDKARAERDASWRRLLIVAVLALMAASLNFWLALNARNNIFIPLLDARDYIIKLAEGGAPGKEGRYKDRGIEINNLFLVLDTLRLKLQERSTLTAKLQHQATTDGLTGLLNRRMFDEIGRADAEFDRATSSVGLILMDIDHFKFINDHYGHIAGDKVLKSVADVVMRNVRQDDIAARYGGEEFAVVIQASSIAVVGKVAETLRQAIESHEIELSEGLSISVTASFGVAVGDRGELAWSELIRATDKALYLAKARGRNMVCSTDDLV